MSSISIWAWLAAPFALLLAAADWRKTRSLRSAAVVAALTMLLLVLAHSGYTALAPAPDDDQPQECERHAGPFGC